MIFALLLYAAISNGQDGLTKIHVEKFYVSNAADAAAADAAAADEGYQTGTLPSGSITWRIYAELEPGWGVQAVYGVNNHPLELSTTTSFYNHPAGNPSGGPLLSNSDSYLGNGTTYLDSYLSCGAVAPGRFGVVKSEDNQAAVPIGGGPNINFTPAGVLAFSDTSIGLPLTSADGMYNTAGNPALLPITLLGDVTDPAKVSLLTDGSSVGSSFVSTNSTWGVLGEQVGAFPAGSNRVLVGQFTTNGTFIYKLNLQLRNNNTFQVRNFVHDNPVGNEILFPSLSGVLNLSCLPTNSLTTVTACDVYSWNNADYTVSGTYIHTTTNASGCDSTATLVLTITPAPAWYADVDADGFGNPTDSVNSCQAVAGYVFNDNDCNDSNSQLNPDQAEICNGVDDDCDGNTDSDDQDVINVPVWYIDIDGDGYGDAADSVKSCVAPTNYVSNKLDCDDSTPLVGQPVSYFADADGDGYGNPVVDSLACSQPAGFVFDFSDCDDTNAGVNPGAQEVCNGLDDDCDNDMDDDDETVTGQSVWYADADGDGFGDLSTSQEACAQPGGYVINSTDCDDATATAYPGASESCNGVDDDCDGFSDEGLVFVTYYLDIDGDSYGSGSGTSLCADPGAGYVILDGDCDDTNAAINPGASEVCNGVDDNCDGQTDNGVLEPQAPGIIQGDSTGCVSGTDGTRVFSVASVPGISGYVWQVPSGLYIVSGQGTTSITVAYTGSAVQAGISGSLCVQAVNACGTSVTSCVNIELQIAAPIVPGSISGPGKLCPGDAATFSISPVARATSYSWVYPAGMSLVSANTPGNVVNVAIAAGYAGGVITVSASNVCGTSPMRSKSLVVNLPLTPSAITGNRTGLCQLSGVNFSVPTVSNATGYVWTIGSGSIVSGQGTSSIITDLGLFQNAAVNVSAVNGCGTSSIRSMTLNGNPDRPGVITGNLTPCVSSTAGYSVGTVAGASTYNWVTTGAAAVASGQGTKNITVSWGATVSNNQFVRVVASNVCGNSLNRATPAISVASCSRNNEVSGTGFELYPNPATDVINISFTTSPEKAVISIMDAAGRLVHTESISTTGNLVSIPVVDLSSGFYTIVVVSGNNVSTSRFIVE